MTITNLNAPSPEDIAVPPASVSIPIPTPVSVPAPIEQKDNSLNKCCVKVINCKEAKTQMLFSVPMIIVNACFYFISLVSVMFAGHLGKLELAASNLANSWAMVTGFSFMVRITNLFKFYPLTIS